MLSKRDKDYMDKVKYQQHEALEDLIETGTEEAQNKLDNLIKHVDRNEIEFIMDEGNGFRIKD